MALYQSLHLYASPDAFTLAPVFADPAIPRESLVIRRTDGAVLLNAPPSPTLGQEEVTVIHGVLGIIRLNAGDYLVVATDRRRIGSLGGHEVFVLTSHRVMSVRKSQTHITDRQIRDDATYLAMLSELLDGKAFYFSYTYDLTHTVQRRAQMGRLESLPMWQRADERFFWNRFLQSPLISITQRDPVRNNLSRFILPIICGFVSITNLSVHARPISFALVSRRSQYRAGTRYHSRGIDERGHVSNFVETEQIVEVEGAGLRASYVQTRGSIPLFWRQLVGVRYPPRLVIENKPSTSTAFRNHFYEQFKLYGQQIVVNLINKQGYEGPLGVAFARQVLDLKDERLRFIHFDFHEHCRNMRWDRISILVSAIKEDLDEQGYCAVDARNALVKEQVSSVRTNCIDCLDRTNVVQSVLGRRMLERQLRDLGLFAETEQISDIADLERIFKNVWADNADAISVQYSSTGALKTDFTRTGKRSTGGALQDFANTMMRYVKNNFLDGFRQDAIDLFVGRYQVDPSRESPFANQLVTPRTILIPMLLILAGFVAVFALVMPQTTATTAWCLAVALAMALAAVRLMDTYSDEFVSRPQLVPDVWAAGRRRTGAGAGAGAGADEVQMELLEGGQ
ncbi:Phosphoinositide phosphatase sac1 [Polyrhizophydium stewartii]|uniref:Phosphoinositide phosphatase sac1 n=1 Tax=Polyrhizophydium stewartii TaxID=2732419 RepID=A0ABR4NGU0_9FUNG